MAKIGTDIHLSGKVINNGGLVVFPTETVYGLGANALNKKAVKKIFSAKERPSYDPLIVHIDGLDKISKVVSEFPESAKKLADKFWPGPLTMILPKHDNIPYEVTSNLESVGVRIPSHPVALKFLKEANVPIAGPSANKFGYISPTESNHLSPLLDSVDYILEGGSCKIGLESTIISLIDKPTILRKGFITPEEIEKVIGPVEVKVNSTSRPEAPGMLERHYAPKTPLKIFTKEEKYPEKSVYIAFGDKIPDYKFNKIVNLSKSSNSIEAAENLYRVLRELDSSNFNIILTNYLPEGGINDAINDKLKRASVS